MTLTSNRPVEDGQLLFAHYKGTVSAKVDFFDRLNDRSISIHWPESFDGVEIRYGVDKCLHLKDAKHKVIGSGIAQRDVYHFTTKDHCKHLRAGLTVHRSIASSTPHTFELSPEPGFEELFWFKISDNGKAVIEGEGLWPDGSPVDAAWPVRDGDIVQVPMGSHRVVALPDVDGNFPQVSYIWCYLATHERWEKV